MQIQNSLNLQKQEMKQAQEYIKEMLGEFLCALEDYANCNSENQFSHYQKYNNFKAGKNRNKIELRNRVIFKLKRFKDSKEDYDFMFKTDYCYPNYFKIEDIETYLNCIKDDNELSSYVKLVFFNKELNKKNNIESICINQVKNYESNNKNILPNPNIYGKYGPYICYNANLIGKQAAQKFMENQNYIPELEIDRPIEENIYNRKENQFKNYDFEIDNFNTKKNQLNKYC